jgi:hypothetical protein
MMLSHEILDPERGKRVLIDQAFIVASGEITKQALNRPRHRTRRLAATVDHLHGPQRHPGLVRSEQPSLARIRALTANLARRPTLVTRGRRVACRIVTEDLACAGCNQHDCQPHRAGDLAPKGSRAGHGL